MCHIITVLLAVVVVPVKQTVGGTPGCGKSIYGLVGDLIALKPENPAGDKDKGRELSLPATSNV
jgi:hypothetical protein